MKKKLKTVLGLVLITTLVGCGNSAISFETAKKRQEEIYAYYNEYKEDILTRPFVAKMKINNTFLDGNKNEKENSSITYYNDKVNKIIRIVADVNKKTSSSSTVGKFDVYIGKINDVLHFVEVNSKKYSTSENVDFVGITKTYIRNVEEAMPSPRTAFQINWEADDLNLDKYTFISKGEGHLRVIGKTNLTEELKDFNRILRYEKDIEFDNYLLKVNNYYSSSKESTKDGELFYEYTFDRNINFKWGCELSMPSLTGFENVL